MNLEEYITPMLPMIKLIDQEKKHNPAGYKTRQLWYIYRQYYYGFAEFIPRHKLLYASINAQIIFDKIEPGRLLIDQNWIDQPRFDPRRKIFNLDHIFTGDMFRNAIDQLLKIDNLTVDSIVEIITNQYRMAWILKSEEKLLPRSNRGITIKDALEVYSNCGIEIITTVANSA